MLHTKFRVNRSTCSGKEIFEVIVPYVGMASGSCDLDAANKLPFPYLKGAPHK